MNDRITARTGAVCGIAGSGNRCRDKRRGDDCAPNSAGQPLVTVRKGANDSRGSAPSDRIVQFWCHHRALRLMSMSTT